MKRVKEAARAAQAWVPVLAHASVMLTASIPALQAGRGSSNLLTGS